MTHGAYLAAIRTRMYELGIIDTNNIVSKADAEELVTVLPTMVLEHVVNSPDGVALKHEWTEGWVKLCQDEYAARMLLL